MAYQSEQQIRRIGMPYFEARRVEAFIGTVRLLREKGVIADFLSLGQEGEHVKLEYAALTPNSVFDITMTSWYLGHMVVPLRHLAVATCIHQQDELQFTITNSSNDQKFVYTATDGDQMNELHKFALEVSKHLTERR